MIVLDLPVTIDPVRITNDKIDLIVAVIVRKFTGNFLINPSFNLGRYYRSYGHGNRQFLFRKDRTGSFSDGDPLRSCRGRFGRDFFYGGVALRLFNRLFFDCFGFLARRQGHRSGPF
jgi:hypothetical protein